MLRYIAILHDLLSCVSLSYQTFLQYEIINGKCRYSCASMHIDIKSMSPILYIVYACAFMCGSLAESLQNFNSLIMISYVFWLLSSRHFVGAFPRGNERKNNRTATHDTVLLYGRQMVIFKPQAVMVMALVERFGVKIHCRTLREFYFPGT